MMCSEGEAVPGIYGIEPSTDRAYGCIFCLTGKEQAVAENIQKNSPEIEACSIRRIARRSKAGRKYLVEEIVLPGYVFFRGPHTAETLFGLPRENVLMVLTPNAPDWRLYGKDEAFARWMIEHEGLIDISQALIEGDRIRIASGPLKDFEGQIRRIDRRNRSGQVVFNFNGREVAIWLGFEIVEKLWGASPARTKHGEA